MQLKLQLSLPFIDQSDLSPWGKSAVVTVVVVELQYVAHTKVPSGVVLRSVRSKWYVAHVATEAKSVSDGRLALYLLDQLGHLERNN